VESFKDWSVYSAGRGADRSCFAVSMPKETTPANVKREHCFVPDFLVAGAKKENEPSIVAGYPFKSMSKGWWRWARTSSSLAKSMNDGAWMEKRRTNRS